MRLVNVRPAASEVECVLRDGMRHTRSLREFSGLCHYIRNRTHAQRGQRAISKAVPLALGIGTPGIVDLLRFIPAESYVQPLGPLEVELVVHSVGLNFKDLLTARVKVEYDRLGV
jgi:hypothetical protein